MAQFSFTSLNKERLFNFDTSIINELHPQTPEERKIHDDRYTKLQELYKENGADMTYQIRGAYINTKSSENEESPVIALSTIYVNIPQHQLLAVKSMIADKGAVRAINNGYAGFRIRPYQKKRGNKMETYYEAIWCDVDPSDFDDDSEADLDTM